jgi:hypothetical protein
MKKKILFLTILLTFLLVPTFVIGAYSYNYDFFKNPIYSSEGLTFKDAIDFEEIFKNGDSFTDTVNFIDGKIDGKKTKEFINLTDLSVCGNEIYVLDGANTASKDDAVVFNVLAKTEEKITEDASEQKVSIYKHSGIYILNPDYTIKERMNIFEITDEAAKILAESYYYEMKDGTKSYLFDAEHPENVTVEQIQASTILIDKSNKTIRAPFFAYDINPSVDGYETCVLLNSANGLYVTEDYIYVADSGNARILGIRKDNYVVDKVYTTPNDEGTFYMFNYAEETTTKILYQPSKIVVDGSGRLYTIATNTYQGIIEYNQNGEFNRFLGKNLVTKRSWWSFLLSEEQYAKLSLNLPSEFTNLTLDDRQLIYATAQPDPSATTAAEMIKLINTSGKDVLKRNGYVTPDGDIKYASYVKPAIEGSSKFTAIDVNKDRIYSVADRTRGRIFTYDEEGNLLYVSGEKGDLESNIKNPVALRYFTVTDSTGKNALEYVLLLDQGASTIMIYETTQFGKLVNEATSLYLNNDIHGAKAKWEEVSKMNSNYELAYVGIGKSLLRNGDYNEAMKNFELGHNAEYYSDAFKLYRNDLLKENFGILMTGIVIVTVAGVALVVTNKIYQKNLARSKREEA